LIPQAHITNWRASAPWQDDAQVEQDLVLSRALVELFASKDLQGKLALRGGTALSKLFLPAAVRYSEDIDLVQVEAAPIGPILDAIRGVLDPWLGDPKRSASQGNMTLTYRFQSEVPPVRPLRLKVETSTREHFTVLGYQKRLFNMQSPWFTGAADVMTYAISEILGTKLRALYQRRKGRDLFDLWLCIDNGMVDPAEVIKCFSAYMQSEGHLVSRAQFEQNLYDKGRDPAFLADIMPLLASHVMYNRSAALAVVSKSLIEQLPGEPWAGSADR
jgi:predicted nucleotidyltransferase component of viral defense system